MRTPTKFHRVSGRPYTWQTESETENTQQRWIGDVFARSRLSRWGHSVSRSSPKQVLSLTLPDRFRCHATAGLPCFAGNVISTSRQSISTIPKRGLAQGSGRERVSLSQRETAVRPGFALPCGAPSCQPWRSIPVRQEIPCIPTALSCHVLTAHVLLSSP